MKGLVIVIAKQKAPSRFIYKIHSSRLRKAKWDLVLPMQEARRNEEVVSLSDSQMLRWIDELNNVENADLQAKNIKKEIKMLKKEPNSLQNRKKIRELYEKLDNVLFKPDYMCLIIDRENDLRRACKGFKLNGVEYERLLGTNGGVKNSTIIFVSKRLAPELKKRIANGRDESCKLVPAKFEAYRALTCSGSIPVSMPDGILVVNDCETTFREDVMVLDDSNTIEPELTYAENKEIRLDASDGFGLMLPSLAERWSEELGLDYIVGGVNTRFSWEKGMLFTFDFVRFANEVAKTNIVKDAWGNDVDITKVEVVLTTSMLKLWSHYPSLEEYLRCCEENHYTFGVTKTCPRELERERSLNYQFIQSYDLDDEQIERLIKPTMEEIRDVLSGDWRKAVLFLKGMHLNEDNVQSIDNDYVKAIMIDNRIFDDNFIKKKIYHMIRKRINDAKIGVLKVHGNYSIASGDPYALCQSIFGMEVTGLLGAGEVYNGYWVNTEADNVVCFRAPMTCHNNIRLMKVNRGCDVRSWYEYMNTCTIFNAWDTATAALNGMDYDGDLVLLTDNEVLVDNYRKMPTLVCVQRNAEKVVITEERLIQSNIDSFGDDIGKTTNWITTMFDVQSQFSPDSEEYKVLDYRIMCGQLYQQNAIDAAKGIIANPMPASWHERHANRVVETDSEDIVCRKNFNMRILADKKPYFMRYIYQNLMNDYNTYIKQAEKKCLREYRIDIDELIDMGYSNRSEEQNEFLRYYYERMPLGIHNCVMNKICKRFEEEFDMYFLKNADIEEFDYSIMKSDAEYTKNQYYTVLKMHSEYIDMLTDFIKSCKSNYVDKDDMYTTKEHKVRSFKADCISVCSNAKQLCNIILDICYKRSGTKQFCWDICKDEIIDNLLEKNNRMIGYPRMCDDGDISFGGNKFVWEYKEVKCQESLY